MLNLGKIYVTSTLVVCCSKEPSTVMEMEGVCCISFELRDFWPGVGNCPLVRRLSQS